MGIKGRPPEKGVRGLTFTHDKCKGGKPRQGWLSGDVHVLKCHVGGQTKKSKPCERVLLGTNAPCPGCSEGRAVDDIGYVPLRDFTGRPTLVLVRREVIPFVGKMKLGLPVNYGREEGDFQSVFVVERSCDRKWEDYFSHPANDDLMPWLATFLGVAHLAPAIRELFTNGACQPVVTETAPVVESLPPTVGELTVFGEGLLPLPTLADTTRRLDAKKERERRNAEFARNGHLPGKK